MSTEFRDLSEFFDDSLHLPIKPKVYRIHGPSAEVGLLCEQLLTAGVIINAGHTPDLEGLAQSGVLDDNQELDLYQKVLGPVYDEMIADGLSWTKIKLAGTTAILWIAIGLEVAISYWNSGGLPEAVAPANRAERRSKSTAGATTTKKPASTSTTSSRTTSARARAKASRGGRS